MDGFSYEELVVWQKAMELVRLVYQATRRFPLDERFALTDQLRRAVVSIPSNIAEGNGRGSNKDYAHFLSIARGSLYETMTQLRIAKDLGYLDDYSQFEDIAAEVGRMLGAMLKKYGSIHCSPSP
jgi:four helix bundle protein